MHPTPQDADYPLVTVRAITQPWLIASMALLAMLVAYCIVLIAGLDGTWWAHVTYLLPETFGVALCAARVALVARHRAAWTLLTVFALGWMLGDAYWEFWLLDGDIPAPNPADAFYVISYAGAIGGLIVLLRATLRPLRLSLALDGVLVALAVGAVMLELLYGPQLREIADSGWEGVTITGYLVLDLVLLCIAGVALGQASWRPGWAWGTILTAVVVLIVADALFGYIEFQGSSWLWTYPLYPLALGLLGVAAWLPGQPTITPAQARPLIVIPTVAAFIALGVLLVQTMGADAGGIAAGLTGLFALMVAAIRTTLALRENVGLLEHSRQEALTDGLTGLGNRRALMAELDETVERAQRGGGATLLFFDLDGFKIYNDTFGHAAGDALLARLGQQLRGAVRGWGTAYRLGGDEFCVLVREALAPGAPRIETARAALIERGEGFSVGASCGSVALPHEAGDASEALRLADERMYAAKGTGRASVRVQARDMLLALLRERDLELGERHAQGSMTMLAMAVARAFNFTGSALDELARGAELHDIGKVGLPESILMKPATLDDNEWRVVCQHTVIGARVLAAAPAMRPIAALVRSSHERWDGQGYPDGLVGDEIPLGSRIIGVCDAYDAMRRERPYASALTIEDALDELRAGAGTQFDPMVVDAFLGLYDRDPAVLGNDHDRLLHGAHRGLRTAIPLRRSAMTDRAS